MKLADLMRVEPGCLDGEKSAEIASTVRGELFTYHPWDEAQQHAGERVRDALANAFLAIQNYVPSSPTRTRALNMLLDARMLANAAITFKGEA